MGRTPLMLVPPPDVELFPPWQPRRNGCVLGLTSGDAVSEVEENALDYLSVTL